MGPIDKLIIRSLPDVIALAEKKTEGYRSARLTTTRDAISFVGVDTVLRVFKSPVGQRYGMYNGGEHDLAVLCGAV